MAKFDLKFIDYVNSEDFIKAESYTEFIGNPDFSEIDLISINGLHGNVEFEIVMDKSTAIKFAKTLRTEINKIQD